MHKACVSQFPGLHIESLLDYFKELVDTFNYLPDLKPVLKVPRNYILELLLWLLRSLKSKEFDKFVQDSITLRRDRLIKNNHQTVELLSEFLNKLRITPL